MNRQELSEKLMEKADEPYAYRIGQLLARIKDEEVNGLMFDVIEDLLGVNNKLSEKIIELQVNRRMK